MAGKSDRNSANKTYRERLTVLHYYCTVGLKLCLEVIPACIIKSTCSLLSLLGPLFVSCESLNKKGNKPSNDQGQ